MSGFILWRRRSKAAKRSSLIFGHGMPPPMDHSQLTEHVLERSTVTESSLRSALVVRIYRDIKDCTRR